MDRTIACLFAFMIGVPLILTITLCKAIDVAFIDPMISGIGLLSFLVAVIFEIKRLVDLPTHH